MSYPPAEFNQRDEEVAGACILHFRTPFLSAFNFIQQPGAGEGPIILDA